MFQAVTAGNAHKNNVERILQPKFELLQESHCSRKKTLRPYVLLMLFITVHWNGVV